jgi:hypothetical protein
MAYGSVGGEKIYILSFKTKTGFIMLKTYIHIYIYKCWSNVLHVKDHF